MRHVAPVYQKGDVVLVSMSEQSPDGLLTKRRPAVIVSSKVVNQAMIVPLTANTAPLRNAFLIEKNSSEGRVVGLRFDSSVDCTVIATVPTAMIVCKIGRLAQETIAKIDERIKRELNGDA